MLAGNREFVRKNPVATKRVVRAMLKATDLCASEPKRARGGSSMAAYATLRLRAAGAHEIPYAAGATTTPRTRCGSTRCGCTRRHDQVDPDKIIAEGTDWRFLNEVKRELKT